MPNTPTCFTLWNRGLEYEGRQVETPIGRIDLLCRGIDGKYVVIEIKANEANDAVFGQILRYIGWIHRNFEDGEDNVRGIILAGHFPEKGALLSHRHPPARF